MVEADTGDTGAWPSWSLLDDVADAVVVVDLDGRVRVANRAAHRLFGWAAGGDAPARPDGQLGRMVAAALDAGDAQPFDGVVLRADGGEVRVEATVAPVHDPDGGRRTGAVCVARDLTPRLAAERVAARLASVVLDSPQPVMFFDAAGRALDANQAAEELLDVEASELTGLTALQIGREHGELLRAAVARAISGDAHTQRVTGGSGREFDVHLWPVRHDGRVLGAAAFTQDVTDRVQRERALQQANADLAGFADHAAHDLHEPLRSIRLTADALARGELTDAERSGLVEAIAVDAARLSAQFDAVIDIAKGGSEPAPARPVPADPALDDALAAVTAQLAAHGCAVERRPLPAVRAPRAKLALLLQNLVINAARHAGGVIRVTGEPPDPAGIARITVSDNGPGIDPSLQQEIFEPFHRAGPGAGQGLGLALCRRIARRYGGEVIVSSRPGRGATFTVELPGR